MMWLLIGGLAVAGDAPEVAVVGVHLSGLGGSGAAEEKAAEQATLALAAALEREKLEAILPADVAARLAGKERLALEDFALGPGRELMQEARILYDRAQPKDAIPLAEEAVAAFQASLAFTDSPRELQDALLLLGLCWLADSDPADSTADTTQADEAFRRAAVVDPARALENASYSPEVRQRFDRIRAQVAGQPAGTLTVQTTAEASVWIDGRSLGPAPLQEHRLVPGPHTIVVRGADGAVAMKTVTVLPGQNPPLDLPLERRNLGAGAPTNSGRSRQIRSLYQGLGRYSGSDLVLIAGVVDSRAMLQLYDPQSSTFSRTIIVDVQGAGTAGALETLTSQIPLLASYASTDGGIKPDKVSPQVLPLYPGTNDLLAGMLLDPAPPPTTTGPDPDKKGVPWYLWAGIGAVVAGGGGVAAAVLLNEPEEGPAGTITVILP